MRFSETRVEYAVPPPLLGEHTREVLGELLGMRHEELNQLAALKII
jgi:crotonobetainyl-CoA:carnitine CoA-transferase CaiB-like acyl-CoA transferase